MRKNEACYRWMRSTLPKAIFGLIIYGWSFNLFAFSEIRKGTPHKTDQSIEYPLKVLKEDIDNSKSKSETTSAFESNDYSCVLHPSILEKRKGYCSKCGIELIKTNVNIIPLEEDLEVDYSRNQRPYVRGSMFEVRDLENQR